MLLLECTNWLTDTLRGFVDNNGRCRIGDKEADWIVWLEATPA